MHVITSMLADAVVVLILALVAIEALRALRHPRRPQLDPSYARTSTKYEVDEDPGFRQLGLSVHPPIGGGK